MKRTLIALVAAAALSGCSGLQTAWRLQVDMRYSTPEDAPAPAAAPAPAPAVGPTPDPAEPKKAT